MYAMTYEELQESYHLVVGSPQTVLEKLSYMHERLGFGALLLEGAGALPHGHHAFARTPRPRCHTTLKKR